VTQLICIGVIIDSNLTLSIKLVPFKRQRFLKAYNLHDVCIDHLHLLWRTTHSTVDLVLFLSCSSEIKVGFYSIESANTTG